MVFADLSTPCLLLDRDRLVRNLARMRADCARLGVAFRPHMKTAKCAEIARLALDGTPADGTRGITVSTLAEAEHFAAHGLRDMLYAVGIAPQKLDRVARLNQDGAQLVVITDDPDAASAIAAHPRPPRALIEVDSGEHRGGVAPSDPALLEIARRLGPCLAGVMTHGGHSYAASSPAAIAAVAEEERARVAEAARRLRETGHACEIVSLGSSPTLRFARDLAGVTEARPGVAMFGDLFQAGLGTHGMEDIALTVLATVIGRRPGRHQILLDAGALALSKDRSTANLGERVPGDCGFGLVVDEQGRASLGRAVIVQAYQEHGVVACDPALPFPDLEVGARVRVLPNHACLTAAAYPAYHVICEGQASAVWSRVNYW